MFGREPALWLAFIQAALALIIGFGVKLSGEQVSLILAFSAALFGLIVRASVTPNAKISNGTVVGILMAIAMLILPPSATASDRFVAGVDVQGVIYESADVGAESVSGVRAGPYAGWLLSDQLTIGAKAGHDFTNGRRKAALGMRASVIGYRPEDRLQAALSVDLVQYFGELPASGAALETFHEQSWQTGINLAWLALTTGANRDLGYAVLQVSYDPDNGLWEVVPGLKLQFFGGGR